MRVCHSVVMRPSRARVCSLSSWALAGGWVGQIARRLLLSRHGNQFGATTGAAAAACATYLLVVEAGRFVGTPRRAAGTIGAAGGAGGVAGRQGHSHSVKM